MRPPLAIRIVEKYADNKNAAGIAANHIRRRRWDAPARAAAKSTKAGHNAYRPVFVTKDALAAPK
jgi:hypothetical protein